MSHRVFKVENRLAKKVQLPGGRTVAEAVASAGRNVEALRESSIASIDPQIARLGALVECGPATPRQALAELYRIAGEIYGVAAAFELKPLAEAAYGLCDLVDAFRGNVEPHWPAVAVHINALRLLAAPGGPEPRGVLDGLRVLRLRYLEA